MTEKMQNLLSELNSRDYRKRRESKTIDFSDLPGENSEESSVRRLCMMLREETPVFLENDSIGFYRSNNVWPKEAPGNITPNYARVIAEGFNAVVTNIYEKMLSASSKQCMFYKAVLKAIFAVLEYSDRYSAAVKQKDERLYRALSQIPRQGATTFYEACVFLKLIIFTLRCNGNSHITLGHFDRYMYPYYKNDIDAGVSKDEILETLENFFISINFDTDLYAGVQQGDNGQSMVLGGRVADGTYEFNDLARMCMDASLELNLIDPKINLRVCKDTPFEIYLFGTKLTKKGLGFPQYCNDDIVIPGMIKLGYDKEDVINYTVAACWEYLVPDCAMDIPNLITMNFPKVVNDVCHASISECKTFNEFMEEVRTGIRNECDRLIERTSGYKQLASPYLSLFIDGCLEKGQDLAQNAAKYNNYGCHGAGISNAADALAAIKKVVFDEKSVSPNTLLSALDADFEGYHAVRRKLLECPKTGNNDDDADGMMCELMDCFSTSMNGRKNSSGGIYRAGTGSAMEYIWSAKKVPATADGRKAYEPYGSSFSPAITTKLNGPLSVIQSFTKYDMKKIINGGPLTMEIHDTTFRNEMGVEKVAQLVKSFVDLGGHQLQLNSINRECLLDAKQHPEKYPNLIVRVWGWSGYFAELAPEFQNHIISRTEFSI